jgi:hypothetical protein
LQVRPAPENSTCPASAVLAASQAIQIIYGYSPIILKAGFIGTLESCGEEKEAFAGGMFSGEPPAVVAGWIFRGIGGMAERIGRLPEVKQLIIEAEPGEKSRRRLPGTACFVIQGSNP